MSQTLQGMSFRGGRGFRSTKGNSQYGNDEVPDELGDKPGGLGCGKTRLNATLRLLEFSRKVEMHGPTGVLSLPEALRTQEHHPL